MKYSFVLVLIYLGTEIKGQNNLDPQENSFLRTEVISFENEIDQIGIKEFGRIRIPEYAEVVALGEANHGTREFQILKHKLTKYLIEQHNFNTIVFEFPFGDGLLINDYVTGKDDAGIKILTGRKDSEYHNQEFLNFIEDIKTLNTTRGESDKIQFLGADIFGKPSSLKRLIEYFEEYDGDFYEQLDRYEYLIDDLYLSAFKQIDDGFEEVSKLIGNQLIEREDFFRSQSSDMEFGRNMRLVKLLAVKWKGNERAKMWASNTNMILKESSNNKIVLLGHNKHLAKASKEVGHQLRKILGEKYFSIGTNYYSGSFMLKNVMDRQNIFPDVVDIVPTEKVLSHHISLLKGDFHYLKFPLMKGPENSWLFKSMFFSSTGFGFNYPLEKAEQFGYEIVVPKYFDAVFVFDKISPTILLND